MGTRLDLQTLLENVLGTNKVYFQPPSNIELSYPCIIYKRDRAISLFADNDPYNYTKRYMITLIAEDPDNLIFDKIMRIRQCTHSRFFVANNLNHDVFMLYY